VKQNKLASLQTLNDVFHEFDYHHVSRFEGGCL
jgi:hypothetical protein